MNIFHIYEEERLRAVAITRAGALRKAKQLAESKKKLIESVNKEAVTLEIREVEDGILLECKEKIVFTELFDIVEQEVED